jgi:cardiolipin synthase A/B
MAMRDGREGGPRIPAIAVGGGAVAAGAAALFGRAYGRSRVRRDRLDFDLGIHVGSEEFLRLTEALGGAPVHRGSRVRLLVNGDETFPAMLETIRSARRSLALLSYIYWTGAIAEGVADAVAERAAAGVECRLLLDAFGARRMPERLVERMRGAGARVEWFRPLRPATLRRANNRTHRRVLVADGRIGMTGGVGIAEEWTGNAQDPGHWRDDHALIEGPAVRPLLGAFAQNWLEATGEPLGGRDFLPPLEPLPGGVPAQVLASSPGTAVCGAEVAFYFALAGAAESIDIQASYFAPPSAFVEALARAAGGGVRVRAMTSGRYPESPMVRAAGRRSYGDLLAAGVEIHEYDRTVLHAKTMVVDGIWSVVGTANFDHRSLGLNDEIALGVQDRGLAGQLTECFEADLADCRRIDAERWRRRGALRRAREQLAYAAGQQL